MNYTEALAYLEKSCSVAYKHGLDALVKILKTMNSPQNKLKIIHIAGTNGKGSTCAMLRYVLTSAGYKTGMFTSPHLERVNERICIDGCLISDDDFARHISIVKNASEKYFGSICSDDSLAFFEILTLAAFNYFFENNVDYAIMETGLGGRLDATNVVENPIVSVITSISLDHTQYLGNTVEEITREKCGIIKKNCPVVLYLQSEKVYNIVKNVCNEKNSYLYYDKSAQICALNKNPDGTQFRANSPKYAYSYPSLEIKLLGEYQLYNAGNVLMVVHALRTAGLSISDLHVCDGLFKAAWPGRMEMICNDPLVLLDGAHNADGVDSLISSILKYYPNKKVTMIIGVLKDKDYSYMVNKLVSVAETVVLTNPDYSKRTLELCRLFECIDNKKNKKIYLEEDFKRAFKLAIKTVGSDGMICCAGSLYLVGSIRKYALEVLLN